MKYYHATSVNCAQQIALDGEIRPGYTGEIFLADSVDNAVKFVCFRLIGEQIVILEIDGLDESKISESYDHSEAFFGCKAWCYEGAIPYTQVTCAYISTPVTHKREEDK